MERPKEDVKKDKLDRGLNRRGEEMITDKSSSDQVC